MKIRTGAIGLAASSAVFLALSTPMREASPTVPAAPALAQDPIAIASTQVLNEARTPMVDAPSASPLIREAHSDGGYWYWRAENR